MQAEAEAEAEAEAHLDPVLWDSITCLKHEIHNQNGINNIIYLANYRPSQPENNQNSKEKVRAFLNYLEIGAILNTAIGRMAQHHHWDFYQQSGIQYRENLIRDDIQIGLPDGFLEKCLKHFFKFPRDKAVLIHCNMGHNRSAAAAAAILWATTPRPRPWKTPQEMIEWMRSCQQRDRRCRLLKNPVFEQQVIKWCNSHDKRGYAPPRSRENEGGD